jgi:hypothetical protein
MWANYRRSKENQMSTKDKVYKDVSICEAEGGWIVHIEGAAHVVTSLRKVIAMTRDYLTVDGEAADE